MRRTTLPDPEQDPRAAVLRAVLATAAALGWIVMGWSALTSWETFVAIRHALVPTVAITALNFVSGDVTLRARLLVLALACTAVGAAFQLGTPPGALLFANTAVALAALFLGPIEAAATLTSVLLFFGAIGVGYVRGDLHSAAPALMDASRGPNWVRFGVVFAMTAGMLGTAVAYLVCRLDDALAESRALVARLEGEHDRRAELERERMAAVVAAQTAERFEAIGRFAAGVVHDFQNYLMVVQGSVDELRVGGEPGRVAEVLQGATAATAAMTRQLLATARREDLPAAEVDTREVVEQTLRLLQPGFPSGIQIVRELAPGARVLADPSHVARIVTNLVSNARDALPGGGRIIVRTRPAEGSAEFIELSVTDDGEGMDDATRRRLFEPLFTTKGPNGSGIGLATVHALATRWGGYVRVDTALGKGSTFVIGLKRAKSIAPASLPPERRERSGAASRRTALVVDDDPRVRAVTSRFVSALGYRVVVAGATEEAVAILRSGTNVDLVCTDWWMPGAPATLLLDEIAESGRPLPVVVCSGAVDDTVRRVAADRRAALLGKPYGAPELHDKIREAEAIARGLATS